MLYNELGHILAWGLEAKNAKLTPGTIRCEWSVNIGLPLTREDRIHVYIAGSSCSLNPKPFATREPSILDFLLYLYVLRIQLLLPHHASRRTPAQQNSDRCHPRLPIMPLGLRQGPNHPRDRSGGRFGQRGRVADCTCSRKHPSFIFRSL
jgi:hypothetical protein